MKVLSILLITVFATEWQQDAKTTAAGESCSIEDYSNSKKSSWVTNCPSSCTVLDYVDEIAVSIDSQWGMIEAKIANKLDKSGLDTDVHTTLAMILIKLRLIMASIMSEKEKFESIRALYMSGDIATILSNQSISVHELQIRKNNLQQKYMSLKKEFILQTGFCKVSFKEFQEEVCDIIEFGKNL